MIKKDSKDMSVHTRILRILIIRRILIQIIRHTEGSIQRQSDGSYIHEYVLRDHLGNTRVTFSDANNDGVVTTTDIKQINHYYPFGFNMEGNWNGAKGDNKYGYNGKEWNDDFGLGWNHHDWRFLDVAINRFVTIDRLPEEEEQEQLTPYQFAYDNPIRYDDPDGQCPTCPAAAAGAVVGGFIGGLIEAGSQLYNDGKISDWSAVGGATVQGAVTGGLAGLTAGASLLTTTAVAGVANGIGGAASNAIQGKEVTAGSVAKDVAIGAASAFGGALAGKLVNKVNGTKATTPYQRPNNATTKAQRESVQGKPCVDCGKKVDRMVADHKKPLVKEHYETGKIDKKKMHDAKSVQPQCPTCSAKQGAELSKYSKEQKAKLNGNN